MMCVIISIMKIRIMVLQKEIPTQWISLVYIMITVLKTTYLNGDVATVNNEKELESDKIDCNNQSSSKAVGKHFQKEEEISVTFYVPASATRGVLKQMTITIIMSQ